MEDFEFTDDVLHQDPLCRDATVVGFLLLSQGSFFASLVGHFTFVMNLSYALVAAVGLQCYIWMQTYFAFFKQPEVMLSALVCGYTDYLSCASDDKLDFLGVLFLFA